jgi:dethiobiotin synthetase
MSKQFFVTGIGTGVGKTLVSAILTEVLKADYYKPVQCGNLDNTDSDFVREHLFNSKSVVHPEQVLLRMAASPHAAAAAEGKQIRLKEIKLPITNNTLVVEGAGGALVPLNDKKEYAIGIAKQHKLPVVLVSDYYLGSINHTLLTLHYLAKAKMEVALLVFNGDKIEASKRAILAEAGEMPYIEIDRFEVNPDSIKEKADELHESIRNALMLPV